MSERISLTIDDGTNAKMSELAGGERKRGQWLSDLIAAMYETQDEALVSDLETLKVAFSGIVGQQKLFDGRVMAIERQIAALVADQAARES